MRFHQFKFNPQITFFDFMDKIKSEEFGGKEEFDKIRAGYPTWVKELDLKSGVLREEGYIYTKAEKRYYNKEANRPISFFGQNILICFI